MWKRYKTELFIIFVIGVLFATNYSPGMYVSGWDNLQTELAPSLAVKRAFFSVWEEYQSFGLLAGMAHAADFTRAIYVWLLSLIIPQSAVRYTFQFSMILLGSLGTFRLLLLIGFRKHIALVGSLFYVLNFGSTQIFFLPYEAFSVFFGFLPWEIWIFIQFLTRPTVSKKLLFSFMAINFLGTPQSYAQQIFVTYILVLSVIGAGIVLQEKTRTSLMRLFLAYGILFIVNSFWLLPQLYFVSTSFSVIKDAKTNQLITEDVLYLNQNKGDLQNVLSLNGFFSDQLDKNKQMLFYDWNIHRAKPFTLFVIYAFMGISLLGVFKKNKFRFSFLLYFFITLLALADKTLFFEQMNELLRHNSFINQVFRSSFTKFIIPHALIMSYLLTGGLAIIIAFIDRISKKNLASFICALTLLALAFYALPAFSGKYISSEMKVKIPKPYFSAMQYFKETDKNKRIALLPEYTFWGWFYHSWGYDGSGFLWYGIEQPIVSRTFDVWSQSSESYFWEIKTALEAEDVGKFENVLEKYSIDYLVYDHSIAPIISGKKAIQYYQLDRFLGKSSKVTLEKKWDFLSIYKVKHNKTIHDFVWTTKQLPNIGPQVKITNEDTIYSQYGDYMTSEKKPYEKYYPFLDLTSQTRVSKKWVLGELKDSWYLVRPVEIDSKDYQLSTSSANLETNLYKNEEAIQFLTPFSFSFHDKTVEMQFPKLQISSFKVTDVQVENCGRKEGNFSVQTGLTNLTISSKNAGVACFTYEDATLDQQYGYLVKIDNRTIKGQRLFFYIKDRTNEQAYLEDRMQNDHEYYIVGSRFNHGIGYNFSFQNTSLSNTPSVNALSHVDVYAFPYDVLKAFNLIHKTGETKKSSPLTTFQGKKINYFTYNVQLQSKSSNQYIVLNQSYHNGWKAYQIVNSQSSMINSLHTLFPFFFGKEIKDHVLVSNWANGWLLNNSQSSMINSQLIIIYLPQYLEFAGFGMLIVLTFWLLFSVLKRKKS